MKDWKLAELNQATIRLILAGCVIAYVVVVGFVPDLVLEHYRLTIGYYTGVLVFSLILRIHIVSYPGVYLTRRVLAMVHDYVGISVGLVLGGEATLPLFSLMVWVTLGYGMRFGSRYLATAAIMALLSILITYQLTPYWQAQPYMVMMLILVIILVPAYANTLLIRLRQVSEQATVASQEKERFLAQASHDLRQPIHSISLFTACLRDGQLGNDERRLVDNIDRALSAVEQLFRSLLDIYTLNQGDMKPHLETIDVDALLSNLVSQNSEGANWAGVEVRLRPCRQHVRCDAALLRTLVQNLLSNAFKYAPDKPVLIGCRQHKGKLSIGVYDLGRGISAEHLPHLCNEFYRVREKRGQDIEGVGLGLSIVSRIARLLKLQLSIKSRPDRGTSVIINGLPIVPANVVAPAPDIDWNKSLLGGFRVLLIEDNHNVLQATAMLLRKWGCDVQTASAIPQNRVDCDLVVTDFDLDRTATGADSIAYLREMHGRRIPAIVITGHELQHVQQSLNDPDTPILSKPVRPAELRSLLLSFKMNQMQDVGYATPALS